jgi:dihydrofolate synthase/folylpolyglutamate synthase
MPSSRKDRPVLTRSAALAWLDRRLNYERSMPSSPTGTFGLARMRRLLAAVGSPQDRFAVVHVAGTKGKGSTVAMIAAILDAAGHRVGRYMSPHVHALEERVCVGGEPIASADLVTAFARVIPAVDAMDRRAARRGGRGPTWFEVMTAVAMVHFARKQVTIAVLETGLGGRLDATNVTRPLLSVITSISLDHMALLGPTIGRIAAEKAGIIKRGCPVISGATHPAARRVIVATAARRRARLLQLGRDFHAVHRPPQGPDGLGGGLLELSLADRPAGASPRVYAIGMAGRHQAANASLAVVAALELDAAGIPVPPRAIDRGLAAVRLPARIERVAGRPLVILDAAHNAASMESLVETLDAAPASLKPRVLVFAASGDKQIERMLASVRGRFDAVVLTRYATNPRAATVERLLEACATAGVTADHVAPDPAAAFRLAKKIATPRGLVCVAGSFFLVSEIRPARDSSRP